MSPKIKYKAPKLIALNSAIQQTEGANCSTGTSATNECVSFGVTAQGACDGDGNTASSGCWDVGQLG